MWEDVENISLFLPPSYFLYWLNFIEYATMPHIFKAGIKDQEYVYLFNRSL